MSEVPTLIRAWSLCGLLLLRIVCSMLYYGFIMVDYAQVCHVEVLILMTIYSTVKLWVVLLVVAMAT